MKTEREKLYDQVVSTLYGRKTDTLTGFITPEEFNEGMDKYMDKYKAFILGRLAAQRCPMTLLGLAKITGGCSTARGRILQPFCVAVNELVEEGQILETHMPDGNDVYQLAKPAYTFPEFLHTALIRDSLFQRTVEGCREEGNSYVQMLEQALFVQIEHAGDLQRHLEKAMQKNEYVFAGVFGGKEVMVSPEVKATINYLVNEIETLRRERAKQ